MKNKLIAFRLTDLDFEFLRKMSIKHGISVSKQLRRIIKYYKEKYEKNKGR